MSAAGETLGSYFKLDDQRQAEECAHALAQSQALKAKRALPAAFHEPAAKAMIWALKNLLSDPVSETIAKAWAKAREIKKFADAPPDEVNEAALQEHDIALIRKPAVELVLNGAPTGLQFEFELKAGLVVESAVVTVQGRRVVGARLGGVLGSGSIACGEVTLVERKSSSVALPGALTFAPGIAIPA
jgi:hypothetical protein